HRARYLDGGRSDDADHGRGGERDAGHAPARRHAADADPARRHVHGRCEHPELMHPILGDWRRVGLYLLGWLPIGLLLTAGLSDRTSWTAAAVVFLPLSIVFAFISLNAGYLCRVFPIDARASIWRTALVHIVAAAIASGIWIGIGQFWTALLDAVAPGL